MGGADRRLDAAVRRRLDGVEFDLRKDAPYLGYEDYDFDIPTGSEGDTHNRTYRATLVFPERTLESGETASFDFDVYMGPKVLDQLKGLAGYAADHGVVMGIEPLNRFETSFINLPAQTI